MSGKEAQPEEEKQDSVADATSAIEPQTSGTMSKNALKKLRRQQAYEAARPERQARNKERKIARRQAQREAIANGEAKPKAPRVKQTPCSLRVIIDCSFDDLMTDGELKSLAGQITRCYSENRHAVRPCNVIVTDWNNKLAKRFETVFSNQQQSWKRFTFLDKPYIDQDQVHDTLEKDDLVYLTADADDTIRDIDESKVYIIGGIVDKNRHKNICYEKAKKQGIKTAKLPIGEYLSLATRKVLTVNHVFEIMSRWLEYVAHVGFVLIVDVETGRRHSYKSFRSENSKTRIRIRIKIRSTLKMNSPMRRKRRSQPKPISTPCHHLSASLKPTPRRSASSHTVGTAQHRALSSS